jgi:hypothetical protein
LTIGPELRLVAFRLIGGWPACSSQAVLPEGLPVRAWPATCRNGECALNIVFAAVIIAVAIYMLARNLS